MPIRPYAPARAGLFAIGLQAYWDQFPGLKERLEGYLAEIHQRLEQAGAAVVCAGLVDTAPKAAEAGAQFAAADLDVIFCHAATYATSSQVLPVVQRAGVPVVVLNLQPAARLDYERCDTGEWLAHCSACCVPEIANAFARARVPFQVVSGQLRDDAAAWREIEEWCAAARAWRALRRSRFGFLGHTYPGMLDMYSDFTMVSAQTGAHIEVLEMCDLDRCLRECAPADFDAMLGLTQSLFTLENCPEEDLQWAAQVAAALERMARAFDLDGLAYYYRGLDGNRYERLGAGMILGNSLLTARGVPASGEGDLKNLVAMKILDALGAGGAFTELYAMDFVEQFVLVGHDGPGHLAICAHRPVLRGLGLYHGKRGYGVSVEFSVRHGPVTLLAVTQTAEGGLKLITAQGESIPGPILRIGNTNTRVRFPLGPAEFVNRWCGEAPTHHFALGTGSQAGVLRKFSRLSGLPLAEVC
ncbi:MAG: L-fucose/L-arabinose isomerase family protein [Bryobacteraceae bacterium]|nr:L-fucose/L-arabinose isomerase family protein [Bryobacteraceae bacterium]